jgi:hypothetical protein
MVMFMYPPSEPFLPFFLTPPTIFYANVFGLSDERYELQRRLNQGPKYKNISSLPLDPGGMPGTRMTRNSPLKIKILVTVLKFLLPLINYLAPDQPVRSPLQNGWDLWWLATDETEVGTQPKGLYFVSRVRGDSGAEGKDEGKQKELWEGSLKLAGIKEGDTKLINWKLGAARRKGSYELVGWYAVGV